GSGLTEGRRSYTIRWDTIYTPLPKVANSSIKHLIYRMETFHSPEKIRDAAIHDINYGPVIRPSMLGFDSELLKEALFSREFFRFTLVRNPYARALSNYLDRYHSPNSTVRKQIGQVATEFGLQKVSNEPLGFSDYLFCLKHIPQRRQDIHLLSQVTYGLFDLLDYDFVGSFERIEQDLATVAKRIWDKDNVSLGFQSPSRTNAASKLRSAYSDKQVALINEIYAKDFHTFGYTMLTNAEDLSDPDALLRDTSVTPAPSAQPAG
ncbi:sulfotransferase family 2 domain-containing protein, partial [Roseovarius sp.]|uniref:sulfotransferase family 2 domain-containing protein n=1 Tax=Roseovarius sp. TaxID=1486281 RepID=UPI002601848D